MLAVDLASINEGLWERLDIGTFPFDGTRHVGHRKEALLSLPWAVDKQIAHTMCSHGKSKVGSRDGNMSERHIAHCQESEPASPVSPDETSSCVRLEEPLALPLLARIVIDVLGQLNIPHHSRRKPPMSTQNASNTFDPTRYIIRRIGLTHWARGGLRCTRCASLESQSPVPCLLDVSPPDAGMITRRTIQISRDGTAKRVDFDVVMVFETEEEAKCFAEKEGIVDLEL